MLNTIVTHSPYTKRPKGAKILGACPMFNRTPGEFAEITPLRFLKWGWVKTYYCISFRGMNTHLPAIFFLGARVLTHSHNAMTLRKL